MCEDGNKNGLVSDELLSRKEPLYRSIQLAKDAISVLVSNELEYDLLLPLLPNIIQVTCQSRRKQAESFIADLYSRECESVPIAGANQDAKVKVETFMAAVSDINLMLDYFVDMVALDSNQQTGEAHQNTIVPPVGEIPLYLQRILRDQGSELKLAASLSKKTDTYDSRLSS